MHIFSVRTLTQAIKNVLEGEFPFVWVRGQVSNLSRLRSGHVFFSLKDDDATLSVFWFKGFSLKWKKASASAHSLTSPSN